MGKSCIELVRYLSLPIVLFKSKSYTSMHGSTTPATTEQFGDENEQDLSLGEAPGSEEGSAQPCSLFRGFFNY